MYHLLNTIIYHVSTPERVISWFYWIPFSNISLNLSLTTLINFPYVECKNLLKSLAPSKMSQSDLQQTNDVLFEEFRFC